MAAYGVLVAMFSLPIAFLTGRSLAAALSDEAAALSAGECPSGSSSSAAGGCAGAASDLALGQQYDSLALLQHASPQSQRVRPHANSQERDASPEAFGMEDAEALRKSDAEVAEDRLWGNRSSSSAGGAQQPVMRDVMAAFNDLDSKNSHVSRIPTGRLFPRGYDQGHMPYSEHFQGIQRLQNTHYLFIPGSGETKNMGQVFVAELGSRPNSGAMGTNMVSNGEKLKSPPANDNLINVLEVDGEYWHAGGMTSYGSYLVVGAEAGCSASQRVLGMCGDKSKVHFYDASNPRSPRKLPYVVERPTATAGATALTRESNGKFLLMVGRVDSAILDFYLSSGTSLERDPGFKLVKTWDRKALLASPGQDADFGQYQNLNFVRQSDGKLFMVGTYRTMNGLGDDTADLFLVDDRLAYSVSIQKVASHHMRCESSTCNFQSGAGVYVDSEDAMILYATNWEPKRGYIYVSEFRGRSQGVGGGCRRITGGTCSYFGCSSTRGETDCVDKQCICKEGYCAQDGKCSRR